MMTVSDILSLRLFNHQFTAGKIAKKPAETVHWLGAVQSQVLEMAKWALGARIPGTNVHDINDALNSGKIIRTHILRPTWHFVSAEDIHWMFDLSNPRIKPVYLSYCKQQGTNESTIARSNNILEKHLTGRKHYTKEEIKEILMINGIDADNHMLNTIIVRAEIEGILCNGKLMDNKQTFTLLHEWVPKKHMLCREEALERLARRYFTSHSPATLEDFIWWSGLKISECRHALGLIKDDFRSEQVNGRIFWIKKDIEATGINRPYTLLLPPFDEYVVSYKKRSEIVKDIHYGKVMTKNGLFDPTMMLNGEIVGKWKKKKTKNGISVELTFFIKTTIKIQSLFDEEAKKVERFYKI